MVRSKKIIIVGLFLFLVGVLVFGLFYHAPRLVVVGTVPKNGELHNPFRSVHITFNRNISIKDVPIIISPNTQITSKGSGASSIEIVPVYAFEPNTTYEITVKTIPPYVFSFITEQQGSNIPGWNEQMRSADLEYEAAHGVQDRALISIKARVPVLENGFTVDFSYKTNAYTITLDPPYAQNKSSFLSWIQAAGVTDLSTVLIVYVNR